MYVLCVNNINPSVVAVFTKFLPALAAFNESWHRDDLWPWRTLDAMYLAPPILGEHMWLSSVDEGTLCKAPSAAIRHRESACAGCEALNGVASQDSPCANVHAQSHRCYWVGGDGAKYPIATTRAYRLWQEQAHGWDASDDDEWDSLGAFTISDILDAAAEAKHEFEVRAKLLHTRDPSRWLRISTPWHDKSLIGGTDGS